MRLSLAVAATAASLLTMTAGVAVARAKGSSCGSSGGSSSGGGSSGGSSSGSSSSGSDWSSGSSSDSSSDDGSSTTGAAVCTNTVVGRSDCRSFGHDWDRSRQPRVRVGLGAMMTSSSLAGMSFQGNAEHEVSHAYHYQSPPTLGSSPELLASGGQFDILFLADRMHFGIQSGMAYGSTTARTTEQNGLSIRPRGIFLGTMGALAGWDFPSGNWNGRLGVYSGLRITSITMETRIADCISTSSATDFSFSLQPRVGIDRWLSPWLTADLTASSDVLLDRDLTVALSLTVHTRAYDGNR